MTEICCGRGPLRNAGLLLLLGSVSCRDHSCVRGAERRPVTVVEVVMVLMVLVMLVFWCSGVVSQDLGGEGARTT